MIAAASDWSVLPARGFDEKRATQFFRVLRLIPSSAATEFSDAPSVDSYKATASRELLRVGLQGMVEHYLSSPAHRRGQGVHHTGVRPRGTRDYLRGRGIKTVIPEV